MGSITYIYIYIYIYIYSWRGLLIFFSFFPVYASFAFSLFFTIAHMFRWTVSWKIERDVMMSKRKEWILGLHKSRVENLALLFGGKLRHNSHDKNRQNFWWMEGCMFCMTSQCKSRLYLVGVSEFWSWRHEASLNSGQEFWLNSTQSK